jgi:hypothetical protein
MAYLSFKVKKSSLQIKKQNLGTLGLVQCQAALALHQQGVSAGQGMSIDVQSPPQDLNIGFSRRVQNHLGALTSLKTARIHARVGVDLHRTLGCIG